MNTAGHASGFIVRKREAAARRPRRVLFSEGGDARVCDAAEQLAGDGLAQPVFVSHPMREVDGAEVLADLDQAADWRARAAQAWQARAAHKNHAASDDDLNDELLLAALLCSIGYADLGMSGAVETTAAVLRAGLRGIGLAPGCGLISSSFLMDLGERVLTYADCAVVPLPDTPQLAQIAVSAARSHRSLTGEEPRVALLSFSTRGSAEHPNVDRVRMALDLARRLAPELSFDGELQFDAAFDAAVGKRKAPDSPVAGRANVFIFPNLEAGNIAYKITERIGGARALGPFLQGFAAPWMDLSRGASTQDIADTAVIASSLVVDAD